MLPELLVVEPLDEAEPVELAGLREPVDVDPEVEVPPVVEVVPELPPVEVPVAELLVPPVAAPESAGALAAGAETGAPAPKSEALKVPVEVLADAPTE